MKVAITGGTGFVGGHLARSLAGQGHVVVLIARGLDYTIFKAGMIYGRGDHMLDHLSHIFYTLPIFAMVGYKVQSAAPLAIADFVRMMEAALLEGRLSGQTVAVVGPERLTLEQAV